MEDVAFLSYLAWFFVVNDERDVLGRESFCAARCTLNIKENGWICSGLAATVYLTVLMAVALEITLNIREIIKLNEDLILDHRTAGKTLHAYKSDILTHLITEHWK